MNNGTQTPIVVICPRHTCPWVYVGYSMGGDDDTAAEVADLVGIARTTLREELIEHLKRQHGEAAVCDSLRPGEHAATHDFDLPESDVREFD